jgi:hypothetical protein
MKIQAGFIGFHNPNMAGFYLDSFIVYWNLVYLTN